MRHFSPARPWPAFVRYMEFRASIERELQAKRAPVVGEDGQSNFLNRRVMIGGRDISSIPEQQQFPSHKNGDVRRRHP